MKKIAVGIIGCGAIGSAIAVACRGRLRDRLRLVALCDAAQPAVTVLMRSLRVRIPSVSMERLIGMSDLVVEAACGAIAPVVLERCLRRKRDCLIMSVGGLLGKEKLLQDAERRGVRVLIPSGAVCGIDGLRAAAAGRIDTVTLTTRKPLKGLTGAPYIVKRGIDLAAVKGEKVIFNGRAADAVKAFPKNVNVSAVLSLAGIGAKKTRVRIVTSPAYTKNTHELEVTGAFGRLVTRTENVPSPTNPKTSAMAFYSAIATLDGFTRSVKIGT